MEIAWRLVPHRRQVLQTLAKMPPRWKGPLLERIARVGLDVANYDPADELPTNLALRGPVVRIPINTGRVYFYGDPAKRFDEASTIRLCRALLADAGAFVDVGAHVGLYLWALLPLLGPERPGYFFEPNPELFRVLQANASRLAPHVQGFAAAVDDHDGFTDFFFDIDDSSMSSIVEDPSSRHQYHRSRVPCVRFDSFAREIDLRNAVVKADIEGGEARLLQGMASSRERVLDFVCEVLEDPFQRSFVPEAARLLNADAYLIGDGTLLPSATVSSWYRTDRNWLFTRRPRSVLEGVIRSSGFRIAQAPNVRADDA
jgi:FkbM family methyltransferase